MKMWYWINKITCWHKVRVGGTLHNLRSKIYGKFKNCPHCRGNYWRKNNRGEDYKVSWVMCPRCGYVFCIKCMPFPDGFGACPNCYKERL